MRFKSYLLLLGVFLLPPLLPLGALAGDSPVIVILGDSISAAYNMETGQSWPSLLQERLDNNGYTHRVFNSSISGDTTQGGLSRLPRLLERHHPAVVIIELGGNDGLRGVPIDVTRANLAAMIESSQGAGATVLLAEMRIPPNYGMTYTEQFNGNYALLKEKYNVLLIPFLLEHVALEPGLMQADGIHPNADAQPILLDTVWTILEPEL
ncbi:MAG: arylesterase [Xanthomonadales bacterium]